MRLIIISGLCVSLLGCASEDNEITDSQQESLGGAASTATDPEVFGFVKLSDAFVREGTGVVWRSYDDGRVAGSYIITAGHNFGDYERQNPRSITVKMGRQTAQGYFASKHPTLDLAIVRVFPPLRVQGHANFTRALLTSRPDELSATRAPLTCDGFGETTAGKGDSGTPRWGWFAADAYHSERHLLTVVSYRSAWSVIHHGDSGGPCFRSNGELVGVISLGNGRTTRDGGTLIAMDDEVKAWLSANSL